MKKIFLLLFTLRTSLFTLLLIVCCSLFNATAQNRHLIDSLNLNLKKYTQEKSTKRQNKATTNDTTEANLLYYLSKAYWNSNLDSAINYGNQCLVLSTKIAYKKGIANAHNSFGVIHMFKGENDKALAQYDTSLKLRTEIVDKPGIGSSNNNKGNIYLNTGDYAKALKYYLIALKIWEELNQELNIAMTRSNIGMLYANIGNYKDAMNNHLIAIELRKKNKDLKGLSDSYSNIGNLYVNLNNYNEALNNYQASLEISKKLADKQNIAVNYGSIGNMYYSNGNYTEALKNAFIGLKLSEEIQNKGGVSQNFLLIGKTYLVQKKYNEALQYFNKSLSILKTIDNLRGIQDCYQALATLYDEQGNLKKAFESYKLFIAARDSLLNDEKTKKMMQMQMQSDFDKQQFADSVKASEEKKVIAAKLKEEQTTNYALYGGLALLLVFGGVMFNRFKVIQKQKNIIQIKEQNTERQKNEIKKQKDILEYKNREITKSIEYSLRIQTAILSTKKLVKQYLPDSFILYKPKDIVAGDFYWFENVAPTANNQQPTTILFAACDCTGHGVPGAMVSVVCHNALNRAVREFGLIQPADILNKTAEIVIEYFSKSEENIYDGMDISLCALEFPSPSQGEGQGVRLQWAGANNPLWLLQNGKLIEAKADKQPIGMNDKHKPFTNHHFTLNKGDSVYLFTDGFADQFGGGINQKKLTKKRFKDLVLFTHSLPMEEQGKSLDTFITNYRSGIEQLDDILVMGVRL